jgi:hypothetical protein
MPRVNSRNVIYVLYIGAHSTLSSYLIKWSCSHMPALLLCNSLQSSLDACGIHYYYYNRSYWVCFYSSNPVVVSVSPKTFFMKTFLNQTGYYINSKIFILRYFLFQVLFYVLSLSRYNKIYVHKILYNIYFCTTHIFKRKKKTMCIMLNLSIKGFEYNSTQ